MQHWCFEPMKLLQPKSNVTEYSQLLARFSVFLQQVFRERGSKLFSVTSIGSNELSGISHHSTQFGHVSVVETVDTSVFAREFIKQHFLCLFGHQLGPKAPPANSAPVTVSRISRLSSFPFKGEGLGVGSPDEPGNQELNQLHIVMRLREEQMWVCHYYFYSNLQPR